MQRAERVGDGPARDAPVAHPQAACPMPPTPRRSFSRTLLMVLVFLSPLLGVAVVRRGSGNPSPPRGTHSPGAEEPLVNRAGPDLQASLAQPFQYRLVLQFENGAQLRVGQDGRPQSLSGRSLVELDDLLGELGVSLLPLVRLPAADLAALQQRALKRKDAAPVDFLGMHRVECPAADLDQLETMARRFRLVGVVETAYVQTLGVAPPDDLSPMTPDYSGMQGYLASTPGLDAAYANALGYRGASVRVSDCEYGWNSAHEDLRDGELHGELGQTPDAGVALLNYDAHGTAVAGILKGGHNGYGMNGIAPDCDFYTYTEWSVESGFRRVECILAAAVASALGDVVLLEMQTVGPGGGYGPAEIDPLVWAAVRVASDAGVIVVAAAGNGAEDLDAAGYQAYRDRGSSGAILVGAGSNDGSFYRLGFSSYGQRVDLQAWGLSVFSTGYGIFAELGGDKNQRYTSVFSGTSSASALVAGAVAVLQSARIAGGAPVLDGAAMLSLLSRTGVPQGPGAPIGPAPQLRAALESMPWVGRVIVHRGGGVNPVLLDTAGVPRLGRTWTVNLDLSSLVGVQSTVLVFTQRGSAGVPTRFGELLIDLSSPPLAVFRAAPVGLSSRFDLQLPADPVAVGMSVHAQAAIFADQVQLTNSFEARLGQ